MGSDWELWWEQALEDYETAKASYEVERWYAAVFWIEQAIEKGLKACILKKFKEMLTSTHSLLFLGNSVKMPEKFKTYLRKITPDFVITRYPDATQSLPSDLYDKETLKEKLRMAKEVIEWIKKELNL